MSCARPPQSEFDTRYAHESVLAYAQAGGIGHLGLCLGLISILLNFEACHSMSPEPPGQPGRNTPHSAEAASERAHVRVENLELGAFAIVASAPVNLARAAHVQRRDADGSWSDLDATGQPASYSLSSDCSSEPPCVFLRAGEPLIPKPWSGLRCAAQCGNPCAEDQYHPGVHRLVVSLCDEPGVRFPGPPMLLPPTLPMFLRWRVTENVGRAIALRAQYANDDDQRQRILGHYVALPGTEHPLSPSLLEEFVSLVRSEQGYRDDIVKRCRPGPAVAFEVFHATVSERRSDVILDFGCSSLRVPGAGTGLDAVSMTYFDPSRDAFILFAKRAFPGDSEIQKLDERL